MTSAIDPSDEYQHPVGEHPAWSESYYFNFVDATSGLGMFTRMGLRANQGWGDGLHVVYLGGQRVAFCHGTRTVEVDDPTLAGDELSAGNLTLVREEPFRRWTVRYRGETQDIADAASLITPRKERPAGWFTPATLDMAVTFESLIDPHYAAEGEQGHFEQTGRVTGTISLGDETWEIDGYGVRDKSWGPRTWSAGSGDEARGASAPADPGPRPFVNWFSGNFGPDMAFGCSCFAGPDGMRGQGWLQRGDEVLDFTDITVDSEYRDDSILHTVSRLRGVAGGETVEIVGHSSVVCPTKIPQKNGATFVNEGLARFESGGRSGTGIAEYWHALSR